MHFLANLIGTKALAIKEKEIKKEGPRFIHLAGRKSGLLDWFLNICGINTTTILDVYDDRIEYSYSSLSGNVLEVIPLSKVSNLVCGYFKPVLLLLLAIISFIVLAVSAIAVLNGFMSAITIVLFSFIAMILFSIYYHLKKSTMISIIPNSGSSAGVAFKRSIIEGKNITGEEAQEIIKIISSLVEHANSK